MAYSSKVLEHYDNDMAYAKAFMNVARIFRMTLLF